MKLYQAVLCLSLTFTLAVHVVSAQPRYPAEILTCPNEILRTTCMTGDDYDCIVKGITLIVDALPETCSGNTCPKADFVGCILRLAGHDFMDYNITHGGSDGCLDFEDLDNTGLQGCMSSLFFDANVDDGSLSTSQLKTVYDGVCGIVSLADFIVIAAEAVMSHQSTSGDIKYFKTNFKYGRTTALTCNTEPLPNPEGSCGEVERVFVTRMGLSWREAAALMGVHTLGRAHVDNSGYDGWWSDTPNSAAFNNDYYTSLIAKGWKPETAVNGNIGKNQWVRTDVDGFTNGVNSDGHKEMMLNTDMCLVYTENGQELDASIHDCCAWADGGPGDILQGVPNCGNRGDCCGNPNQFPAGPDIDCGNENNPDGPAATDVRDYHVSETVWLNDFLPVWTRVTEQGFSSLSALALDGSCSGPSINVTCPEVGISSGHSVFESSVLILTIAFTLLTIIFLN